MSWPGAMCARGRADRVSDAHRPCAGRQIGHNRSRKYLHRQVPLANTCAHNGGYGLMPMPIAGRLANPWHDRIFD